MKGISAQKVPHEGILETRAQKCRSHVACFVVLTNAAEALLGNNIGRNALVDLLRASVLSHPRLMAQQQGRISKERCAQGDQFSIVAHCRLANSFKARAQGLRSRLLRLHRRYESRQVALDDGEKEVLLMGEMHIQCASSKASSTCDIACSHAGKTPLLEHAFCRLKDMFSCIHTVLSLYMNERSLIYQYNEQMLICQAKVVLG